MQKSIPAMVRERCQKHPEKTVLRRKDQGHYRDISWQAMGEQVDACGRSLLASGIEPGDRVAIMARNCPEWVYADLGALSAGAVTVPVYHTEGLDALEHILADSGSRVLFLQSPLTAADLETRLEHLPGLELVILLEGSLPHPRIVTLKEFLARGSEIDAAALEARLEKLTPGDLATLVYTSGTTGPPKGAMLTHENILSNVRAAVSVFPINDEDVSLSFLPLSHVFERVDGYYLMLHQGAVIAYAESIDTVPLNLTEVQPTVVISVPRLYEKMFARVMERVLNGPWLKKQLFFGAVKIGRQYTTRQLAGETKGFLLETGMALARKAVFSKLQERLGGRLRFFISGGAPLMRNIAEFFLAADIPIYEGYGLTETAAGIAVNTPEKMRLGTVGRPLPGIELKIAADGEILARGPGVFGGYWNRAELTRDAFRDGWFCTGDIGELDGDGFLAITDRKKDLIVTAGGENIAPQNLENRFKSDKYLANAMVYGDGKPFLTALLVPNFENLEKYADYKKIDYLNHCDLVSHPRILDLIRRRIDQMQAELPSFKRVKRFTLISRDFSAEEGEVTPTLKIKRKAIRDHFDKVLEGMYQASDHGSHDSGFCIIADTPGEAQPPGKQTR
ncbi:AMP-dependent synthetase/ligase [Desulfuromonas carbonis]|uniref:AMP-dependent synthetase/ligase n=1 Tax=Desulfuromonas sp. DDH964 TaxID=1823759 RepID=UPI00078DB702|nr:long-chain fatty acid--CoA ligase [Desulfuromonas sp. DDH964]AMV71318.1 long-chain acyl-CoA synthetase (AMP-forming) [Desulfuromonas sp. DDH964]